MALIPIFCPFLKSEQVSEKEMIVFDWNDMTNISFYTMWHMPQLKINLKNIK